MVSRLYEVDLAVILSCAMLLSLVLDLDGTESFPATVLHLVREVLGNLLADA